MFESFFLSAPPLSVETGEYQLPLVVLSYLVAGFASYTALSLAQQLVVARGVWERRLLHWGGAFAMGAGIWSMHFIGMLSYKMRMVVSYDPALTVLSMLIAILVAYGTFEIVSRDRLSWARLLTGAVILGLGICGMHYTGMAAMIMDGDLRYEPGMFILSLVISISAAGAALWMAFTLSRSVRKYRDLFQIAAALVMGAAICGMHYTGMVAAVFIPYADCRYDPEQSFDALALAIAAITTVILGIALVVSIYKRAQAEEQIQNSEARLRLMIDSALDAVVSMNEQGLITEWNRQAENIFGWAAQEAFGKPLADLIIPQAYRGTHTKGMQRFLAEGVGPMLDKRIEMSALNKTGAEFPIELSITAQKLMGVYHFTAFIRDITDRKRSEQALLSYMNDLKRSNQELEDFAHIASHDLKEPLRGLASLATFLNDDYQEKLDAQGKQWLHKLIDLSGRMEKLISDLLYFSQLGRVELAIQKTDPNMLIDEIRAMQEPFLVSHNAKIAVPRPLPEVVCDRPRIMEVFRNLITNAVKYNNKPEPVIEVGYLETLDTVAGTETDVFYVKDNGIGIAPEFHEAIFRLFKKLVSNVKEDDGSTGAGLTFVKKIIERHRGRIWLESVPGQGTTFYFTLKPKGKAHE